MAVRGVLLVVLAGVTLTWGQGTQVTVEHPILGQIVGQQGVTSRDQTAYWTFHGIPYADSDSYMGVNRFKPAQVHRKPLTENGEPFYAKEIFSLCPQEAILDIPGSRDDPSAEQYSKPVDLVEIMRAIHTSRKQRGDKFRSISGRSERRRIFQEEPVKEMGNEDCLTLAINTPKIPANPDEEELLPVVVFYHGGGSDSIWGSAFTGLRMMEDKIVLITLNYRLGVLGALNLGTDDAPGCAGMYDTVTALEWVQENIKYFGGDPNRVTVTGQSAGSMIVGNLLTTPLTKDKNLFHGVWGFSGAAISVWAVSEEPAIDNHLEIAELAGCYDPETQTRADIPAVTACMQTASLQTLVNALAIWRHEEESVGRLGFDAKMPSIQSPGLTVPYFMPQHPYEVLEKLEQRNVPVVFGATKHDGTFALDDIVTNFILPNELDKNETYMRNELLPNLLKNLGIRDASGELYHTMVNTYLGDAAHTGTLEDKLPGMTDMVTVMAFKAPQYETLKFQSRLTRHAYFYSLDYVGRWTLYELILGRHYIPGGIAHTDDLIYFFWLGPLINEDMKVSRRWMKYFINFVNHGDPNGADGSAVIWEPYDPLTHPYMKLDRHDKMVYDAPNHWVGNSDELFVDWTPPVDPSPTPTIDPPTGSTTPPPTGPTTPPPTGSTTPPPTGPTTPPPTGSTTPPPTGPTTPPPTGPTTPPPTGPTTPPPTGSTTPPPTGPTTPPPTGSTTPPPTGPTTPPPTGPTTPPPTTPPATGQPTTTTTTQPTPTTTEPTTTTSSGLATNVSVLVLFIVALFSVFFKP
ncbi:fatty acyl-CoA hydrolase precursor, medium chain [Folsomia candida]|uniref:Fatty acyl-CoA hydrolase, medium chain n=1 Tax=Folsomia candida TaxID=158441 RepID=A0A226E2V4_FOLCA|nr:fatty acyl-CoA hydrolase precursor, medium chain [Folsomia candida]OXA51364.1 Fatty acyl-CoA hydrolase precursor, medium chain [Folsomia candida]